MFNNVNKDTCIDLESSNSGLEKCVTAKQEMRATDLRRRWIKDKAPSNDWVDLWTDVHDVPEPQPATARVG